MHTEEDARMEPDFHSFYLSSGNPIEDRVSIEQAAQLQRENGAVLVRVTMVDANHAPLRENGTPFGFWIEGWSERPKVEAPFNPPLVAG